MGWVTQPPQQRSQAGALSGPLSLWRVFLEKGDDAAAIRWHGGHLGAVAAAFVNFREPFLQRPRRWWCVGRGISVNGCMHHIDTLNADVKVGSSMDQLLDIKLVPATKSARDEERPLVPIPFERTSFARHCVSPALVLTLMQTVLLLDTYPCPSR